MIPEHTFFVGGWLFSLIITSDERFYVAGCGHVEDAQHDLVQHVRHSLAASAVVDRF